MYFLFKMGICSIAMLVYQRVLKNVVVSNHFNVLHPGSTSIGVITNLKNARDVVPVGLSHKNSEDVILGRAFLVFWPGTS